MPDALRDRRTVRRPDRADRNSWRPASKSLADRFPARSLIVKPFSPTELVARVEAALRGRADPEPFLLGELAIDYARRRVALAGREVTLTATEYELLRVLSLNAGRVATYDLLLRRVWGGREVKDSELVRTFVKRLRRRAVAATGPTSDTPTLRTPFHGGHGSAAHRRPGTAGLPGVPVPDRRRRDPDARPLPRPDPRPGSRRGGGPGTAFREIRGNAFGAPNRRCAHRVLRQMRNTAPGRNRPASRPRPRGRNPLKYSVLACASEPTPDRKSTSRHPDCGSVGTGVSLGGFEH